MSMPHDSVRLVRQWLEKAENDLRNAEHTLTLKDDCPFDTVCFHSQQCAEKYLKALLAFFSVDFPNTHDLIFLKKSAMEVVSISMDSVELQTLNRYSVESRYPGEWEPITRTEAEKAVNTARQVRDVVRSALPANVLA
jgi:HEPN domain-containing protein